VLSKAQGQLCLFCEDEDWIRLAQASVQLRTLVDMRSIKGEEILDQLREYQLFAKDSALLHSKKLHNYLLRTFII